MSVPDIVDWQTQSQSFEQIAAFVSGGVFLSTGDEIERVRGTGVSGEFFPLFKTNPITGRTLQEGDMQEGGEPTASARFREATAVASSRRGRRIGCLVRTGGCTEDSESGQQQAAG